MSERFDLAIAGAGPAGLGTAIYAALNGLSCVVLEKRRPPLDKACGEGIMPAGVRALEQMGVRLPRTDTAPLQGICYVDGDLTAQARFRRGAGLGVRRLVLGEALQARAAELGVRPHYGCAVRSWERTAEGVRVSTCGGTFSAGLLVAADGLHSQLRREAGLELPVRGPRRFGVRRHFRLAPWSPFVEVHWSGDAECYVTPVSADQVGVAFLYNGDGAKLDELVQRFPLIAARLQGAQPASTVRGAGPFRQRVRKRFARGLALVGDAAGYLDPLTGEGISLGLSSARALVETVALCRGLNEYERAYQRLSQSYYDMTGLLLAMAARPRLRRLAVRMLAAQPGLFEHLLAISSDRLPLRTLGVGGLVRLGTRMLS